MRFKVISEEWFAAVDVTRPPRVKLMLGSMSQSVLGEELSRSSRIQHFLRYFGEGFCLTVALSCVAVGSSADFCQRTGWS